MQLVKHCLTVLLGTFFFSFLIISQVGYIHSNHAVSETLSDSSARNVFFSFLIISQVGYIHSNHAVSETLSDSSARNVFLFFSNNITDGLYTFKACS